MIRDLVLQAAKVSHRLLGLAARQRTPFPEESDRLLDRVPESQRLLELVEKVELYFTPGIISYSNIYDCPHSSFSVGIYYLPRGFRMPCHDHPNMFVLSKVLSGSAKRLAITIPPARRRTQFDYPFGQLAERAHEVIENCRALETVVRSGHVDWVLPHEGNLHEFTAAPDENFCFLDVILPHYDFENSYPNFYTVQQRDAVNNECTVRIQGFPEDYATKSVKLELR